MKRRTALGGIVVLALGTGCSAGASSRVEVGSPPPVVAHREKAREVIVVERVHVPKGQAHGWWKKHGYREVTVYYDGTRYYSRRPDTTGFRAAVVYQRDGKYYLGDVDAERHGHQHDDDHGEDR